MAIEAGQSRAKGIEVDAAHQAGPQQQVDSSSFDEACPPAAGFVDLHTHVLWGLDDGPRTVEESLELCRMLVADGVSTLAATCHQRGVFSRIDPVTIRHRTNELTERLAAERIPLVVFPSAEWMFDAQTVENVSDLLASLLTLADRGKYGLIEFPFHFPSYLPLVAKKLAEHGLVGVLAHIEKYPLLLSNLSRVESLVGEGFIMQLNADSIVGKSGPAVMNGCRQWIQRGLVHLVASDSHSVDRRPPLLTAAFGNVRRWTDQATAELLFRQNPRAILAGEAPKRPARLSWLDRFRKR